MSVDPAPPGTLDATPVRQADFTRAVAATGSGVVIADATVRGFPLVYANAAFSRLSGYEPGEFLGRSCSFLQGPETDPSAVRELFGGG